MQEIKEYNQFIKKTIFAYHPVSEQSIMLLQSIAKIKYVKKNEHLLSIGNHSKEIYILYKGIVVSYFLCKDGNMYHKNIFLERDFVGSTVSALTNEPSNFALEAIEDCILISFNYKEYRELIEQNTDLKNFYIAYLEKNWILDKEKREIALVMKDAKIRYLDFMKEHPTIKNQIPLHYIASHLGITPTQLSRIRKSLYKI
ncbi:Crp/Fnr family transcriptional regulator [Aquimarina longa]|uniref:Crp/Fnr family transcriptional regulator n=1 Tax=Aquimarina longa TaxID=1080221 RepID=UPI0007847E1D|nr:Crp/Fnr family transcriptional regulator [Aquimarina longa]